MDFDLATVLTLTSAAARLRAIVDFENYHYYSFRFFFGHCYVSYRVL